MCLRVLACACVCLRVGLVCVRVITHTASTHKPELSSEQPQRKPPHRLAVGVRACGLANTSPPSAPRRTGVRPHGAGAPRTFVRPRRGGGSKIRNFEVHLFLLKFIQTLCLWSRRAMVWTMSTIYTYNEFLHFVDYEMRRLNTDQPGEWRYGQVYFNSLYEFRPSIANTIRATKWDPFHKAEVHPDVHSHVENLWNEMNEKVADGTYTSK